MLDCIYLHPIDSLQGEYELLYQRNGRSVRRNAESVVERFKLTFGGKTYVSITDKRFTMMQNKMKADEKLRNDTLLRKLDNITFA